MGKHAISRSQNFTYSIAIFWEYQKFLENSKINVDKILGTNKKDIEWLFEYNDKGIAV